LHGQVTGLVPGPVHRPVHPGNPPTHHEGLEQSQGGIVAAVCPLGLIVVLKYVVNVPAEVLPRDMIISITVYFGFITAVNFTEETPGGTATTERTYDNPWAWSALVVFDTLAIIAVYVLG
jgi:hypothetical protein